MIPQLPAAPLPALLFAASGSCPEVWVGTEEKERDSARRRKMEKAELEELKEKVPCAAVLEHLGFALDRKESTRKAMKYRREGVGTRTVPSDTLGSNRA